jgi:hypothetical protein
VDACRLAAVVVGTAFVVAKGDLVAEELDLLASRIELAACGGDFLAVEVLALDKRALAAASEDLRFRGATFSLVDRAMDPVSAAAAECVRMHGVLTTALAEQQHGAAMPLTKMPPLRMTIEALRSRLARGYSTREGLEAWIKAHDPVQYFSCLHPLQWTVHDTAAWVESVGSC